MKSYQYHMSMSKRTTKTPDNFIRNLICSSTQIAKWSASDKAELMFIKGSFRSRRALRGFCTGIIEQLRESQVQCIWALKLPFSKEHETETGSGRLISPVDVLKHITMQALKLSPGTKTEKTASLNCSKFHTATSNQEWLALFGSALGSLAGPTYIIIDLEVLSHPISSVEDFNWTSAFLDLFKQQSTRGKMLVKVLFISYGYNIATQMSDSSSPILSIPSVMRRGKTRKSQLSTKVKGNGSKFL
jgi:hypothetical protein